MYNPKIPDDLWPMTFEERGYPIIDVHGHHGILEKLSSGERGRLAPSTKLALQLEKYFRHRELNMEEYMATLPTEDEMAAVFKKYGVYATPVAWVAPYGSGDTTHDNDYIEALVKRHPDIFLGWWGSVDPHMGVLAMEEAERLLRDKKVIGFKFMQAIQKFRVNDPMCYPLWDLIASYNSVVQFHGGYTGQGTGLPGGGGVKVFKYTDPLDMDEVAADFPNLRIIIMHAADPWTEVANLCCMHKGNVYRETSGIVPRYMPERMIYDINRRLQDKFMFGSEFPYFPLELILGSHEKEVTYREGIREKLFYKNALNILGDRFENAGADLSPWKGLM